MIVAGSIGSNDIVNTHVKTIYKESMYVYKVEAVIKAINKTCVGKPGKFIALN